MFVSMFLFIFESPTIIVFVVIAAVLLFGSSKLPQLAKSLGQSRKAFKEGMREAEEDDTNHPIAISANTPTPQITQMSDEELMAEMRRRVEAKPQ
ncbi:MAG: twin-arginine translocase TatA/TatE family subunit [Pyrinomonadaceae bacterium]